MSVHPSAQAASGSSTPITLLNSPQPGASAGVIPPSLPEKTTSKRFDSDVVTQRMQELERFINKVANNAIMQTSSDLKMFLCESNPAAWEARAAWSVSSPRSMPTTTHACVRNTTRRVLRSR